MTYAGLTTADKGALESYLSKGIDRCPLMLNGELQIVDAHEALAQIAEMESKMVTRTNQDAFLEKWRSDIEDMANVLINAGYDSDTGQFNLFDGTDTFDPDKAHDRTIAFLLSPYTEGETDEG